MSLWSVLKSFWSPNNKRQTKPRKQPTKQDCIAEITQTIRLRDDEWWQHNEFSSDHGFSFEKPEEISFIKELRKSLQEDSLHLTDIPENINEILTRVNKEEFDYKNLTELIIKNPALSGDMLATVNSVALSRGIKITNIDEALPRLGQKVIRSVLYMYINKSNLPASPFYESIASDIINKSNIVANIAHYLALHFHINKDEAFLAGLLHDIGKLVIINQCAESFHLPDSIESMHAEQAFFKEIFPEHQQRCGALLAKHWGLEESIVDAIRWNHRIDEVESVDHNDSHLKLAALINLSDRLARLLGYGQPIEGHEIFKTDAMNILQIEDNEQNREIFRRIPELFINATSPQNILESELTQ